MPCMHIDAHFILLVICYVTTHGMQTPKLTSGLQILQNRSGRQEGAAIGIRLLVRHPYSNNRSQQPTAIA
jgi:hypothetical protein